MFFISDAVAQTTEAAGANSSLMSILPIVLMFVLLYFMMIRPQQKKAKEARAMLAALKKGDEVATIGGLLGKITRIDDNYITLDVAKSGNASAEVVFPRGAVQNVLPTGSLKYIFCGLEHAPAPSPSKTTHTTQGVRLRFISDINPPSKHSHL